MHIPKKILKTLVLFSVLALIVIKSKNYTAQVRIRLTDLSTPVLNSFHTLISTSKRIIPFASLKEENRLLQNKIDLLERRIEEMKTISDENQRLKELLDFKQAIPYPTVPAQVIGRDPTNWSNSLIIDKGSLDGISKNKAVLSTRGLVGRIVEVGKRSSKISLISDPNSKVGALIQRNRQGGILVGRPDGKCKMIYISLDSDVHRQDKVMTAGLGSVFPKGILIGEVIKVDKEPGRLYKYAIVKPAQDLAKLEEVLCIR